MNKKKRRETEEEVKGGSCKKTYIQNDDEFLTSLICDFTKILFIYLFYLVHHIICSREGILYQKIEKLFVTSQCRTSNCGCGVLYENDL